MIWKGDNTWFFGLVGQRAIGDLIQYLYNFLYSFFRYIYAQFQKRQQDLNLLQRFSIPIQLFTEDWIVDWAVLAQIVEYSMHPISLKILFYANLPCKWIVLWCLFLLSSSFFFSSCGVFLILSRGKFSYAVNFIHKLLDMIVQPTQVLLISKKFHRSRF